MNLNDDQRHKVATWATLDASLLIPELEDSPKNFLDGLEKAEPYVDLIHAMLGTGGAVAEADGRMTRYRRYFALEVVRKQRDEGAEGAEGASGREKTEHERFVQEAEAIIEALEAEGRAADAECSSDAEDEVVVMIRERNLPDPEIRANVAGRILRTGQELADAWGGLADAIAARVEGSQRNAEPAARSRLAEATTTFGETEKEAVALLGSAGEKGGGA